MSEHPPNNNSSSNRGRRRVSDRVAELEEHLRALERELAARDGVIAAKDGVIAAKDQAIADRDQEITQLKADTAQLKADTEAKSLFAAVSENRKIKIPNLQNTGTPSSHLYPEHAMAMVKESSVFPLHEVTSISPNEWIHIEAWMKTTSSYLLRRFSNRDQKPFGFSNEAAVQDLTHLALNDAVDICQEMIRIQAERLGKSMEKMPQLVTQRERSIFSNRVDHTVVFDLQSQLPLFSIETKKFFNNAIRDGDPNRVYGQSHDQLRAMKAKGHRTPFAAISSFQETLITWLDSDDYSKVLTSHVDNSPDRLLDIVQRLPNILSNTQYLTQSPPRGTVVVTPSHSPKEPSFTRDVNRLICRSEQCFQSTNLVLLYLNVLICALDAVFTPRSYLDFQYGQPIEADAIQMKQKSYTWGTLKTTLKDTHTCKGEGRLQQDLFLIDCLGSGSTSVVYRAVTIDGCDCVVKIFVKAQPVKAEEESDEYVAQGESNDKFQQRAKLKVENEVNAYKEIYGTELDGYVWMQTLNNFSCVIMPFFQPIPKVERIHVLSQVQQRLRQFQTAKMVFAESDQLWRHVGSWGGKIFLFDLGDLEFLEDEVKVQQVIDQHFQRLTDKAGTTAEDVDA
jgi:hypothetical protein